jgi:hypothetical protein
VVDQHVTVPGVQMPVDRAMATVDPGDLVLVLPVVQQLDQGEVLDPSSVDPLAKHEDMPMVSVCEESRLVSKCFGWQIERLLELIAAGCGGVPGLV